MRVFRTGRRSHHPRERFVINQASYAHEVLLSTLFVLSCSLHFSVNFKKNEKVYNPENSEVLKALQENDSEPEPGNDDGGSEARNDNARVANDESERYSHYYALAYMLKLLNSGDGDGSLFSNDKLIE